MIKRLMFFALCCLGLFSSCDLFSKKVRYKNHEYTIENSEFGVAFIDEFNSIEYYMHETVYQDKEGQFYCRISGSLDKGRRWILLKNNIATDIDSVLIDFKSCKVLDKSILLE